MMHRRPEVDALKAFLLIYIAAGHWAALTLPKAGALDASEFGDLIVLAIKAALSFGREAAFLFIFFSGYFSCGWLGTVDSPVTQLQALRKRVVALVPALWVGVGVAALFDYVGGHLLRAQIYSANGFRVDALGAASFESAMCSLLGLIPTICSAYGTNGPLWTLGYLIQFAVLAAIAGLLACGSRWRFNAVLASVGLFATLQFHPEFGALLVCFWAGAASRFYMIEKHAPRSNAQTVAMLISAVAVAVLLRLSAPLVSAIGTPVLGVLLMMILRRSSDDLRISTLATRLHLKRETQMGLYVSHLPVLFFVCGLGRDVKMWGAVPDMIRQPFELAIAALTTIVAGILVGRCIGGIEAWMRRKYL